MRLTEVARRSFDNCNIGFGFRPIVNHERKLAPSKEAVAKNSRYDCVAQRDRCRVRSPHRAHFNHLPIDQLNSLGSKKTKFPKSVILATTYSPLGRRGSSNHFWTLKTRNGKHSPLDFIIHSSKPAFKITERLSIS